MKYVALPLVSLSALALAGVALADPPAPRPAAPTQVTFVNLVTGSPTVGVAIRRTRTDPGTVVIPALTAGGRGTFSGEPGFVQVALRPQGGGADAGPMGQPFPWLIPSVPRVHAFLWGDRGPEHVTVVDLSNSPAPPAGQGLMRFFNLVTNADSVDLCTAGATPAAPGTMIWMNTALGFAAGLPDGASGRTIERQRVELGRPLRWQVRQWADPPCSGRVIASGEVTIPATTPAVFAIAQGSATGTGPISMTLCPEGPGDCRTVPLRR